MGLSTIACEARGCLAPTDLVSWGVCGARREGMRAIKRRLRIPLGTAEVCRLVIISSPVGIGAGVAASG
jgi:hypothetical protein